MKLRIASTILLCFLLLGFNSLVRAQDSAKAITAQDTIFTKAKEKLVGKVIEIGITEIKYKDGQNLDGPVIVFRKDDVLRIKYPMARRQSF